MSDKVHACPFCGTGHDLSLMTAPATPSEKRPLSSAVMCRNCKTVGPRRATEDEAVQAWNTRARPPGAT